MALEEVLALTDNNQRIEYLKKGRCTRASGGANCSLKQVLPLLLFNHIWLTDAKITR
ncbi:MAG: hypothetical protein LBS20_01565 [Prevotella sp.]|jgi:hypothetical protein|nr:hypothetical protein [Prevotella sp.]